MHTLLLWMSYLSCTVVHAIRNSNAKPALFSSLWRQPKKWSNSDIIIDWYFLNNTTVHGRARKGHAPLIWNWPYASGIWHVTGAKHSPNVGWKQTLLWPDPKQILQQKGWPESRLKNRQTWAMHRTIHKWNFESWTDLKHIERQVYMKGKLFGPDSGYSEPRNCPRGGG